MDHDAAARWITGRAALKHRLTRWYRAGVDINGRLPWLSAYMGHLNILGTETYLTATPELLAIASNRFGRLLAQRSESRA